MKYIFTLLLYLSFTFIISAQTPEKISYQAIIRSSDNTLVVDSDISLKILIRQGSTDGTMIYEETHTVTTNSNGLVSLEIGTGTINLGNFSNIQWELDLHFIETQVDITGGSNYNLIGISQLLSVPYALHAKSAESITGPIDLTAYKAEIISLNSSRNITNSDINNTIACTTSSTYTLTANFTAMEIGDTINLEAHNGANLVVNATSGVTLNYTDSGSAQFNSNTGNVRFGLLRKSGANAYIISGQ